jgi:hypothetical protein
MSERTSMRITITLPDDVARKVYRLKNREEFVARAVEAALAQEPEEAEPSVPRPSRWAQVVERIERQADPLGDYAEKLARDQREFRQSFYFRHDEP